MPQPITRTCASAAALSFQNDLPLPVPAQGPRATPENRTDLERNSPSRRFRTLDGEVLRSDLVQQFTTTVHHLSGTERVHWCCLGELFSHEPWPSCSRCERCFHSGHARHGWAFAYGPHEKPRSKHDHDIHQAPNSPIPHSPHKPKITPSQSPHLARGETSPISSGKNPIKFTSISSSYYRRRQSANRQPDTLSRFCFTKKKPIFAPFHPSPQPRFVIATAVRTRRVYGVRGVGVISRKTARLRAGHHSSFCQSSANDAVSTTKRPWAGRTIAPGESGYHQRPPRITGKLNNSNKQTLNHREPCALHAGRVYRLIRNQPATSTSWTGAPTSAPQNLSVHAQTPLPNTRQTWPDPNQSPA